MLLLSRTLLAVVNIMLASVNSCCLLQRAALAVLDLICCNTHLHSAQSMFQDIKQFLTGTELTAQCASHMISAAASLARTPQSAGTHPAC